MKKVVKYDASKVVFIEVGYSAIVHTIDHPNTSNYSDRPVKTSTVLSYDEITGEFETEFSLYKKLA